MTIYQALDEKIKGRYVYGNYIEQSEVRADIQTLEAALRVAVERIGFVLNDARERCDQMMIEEMEWAEAEIAKILAESPKETP